MYIIHRRHHRQRSTGVVVLAVSLLVLGVAAFLGRDIFVPDTMIGPAPPPVTKRVADSRENLKEVSTASYSFMVLPDWEQVSIPGAITGGLSWQNTAGSKGIKSLTIYQNAALQDKAVNKVLPVEVNGAGLVVSGDVSDNCITFTTPESQSAGAATGRARATWQGASFWCDIGSSVRNVVGIAAAGATSGSPGVLMTGESGSQSSIFITYTDNGPAPDYTPLLEAVRSFRHK